METMRMSAPLSRALRPPVRALRAAMRYLTFCRATDPNSTAGRRAVIVVSQSRILRATPADAPRIATVPETVKCAVSQ
eukprot:scaffold8370_cov101-Isochrysis_galbana.AAC.2